MNRQHSFTDQVAHFLAGQNLDLFRSGEGTCFSGSVTAECGVDISLCISCTSTSPSLVRFIATLPIAAPAAVHDALVRVVNVINQAVPCGAFTIDSESGRVCLENAAMIPEGERPDAQLRWLLFLNANVMNRQALTLIQVATGAITAQDALIQVAREFATPELPVEPDPERFRWN